MISNAHLVQVGISFVLSPHPYFLYSYFIIKNIIYIYYYIKRVYIRARAREIFAQAKLVLQLLDIQIFTIFAQAKLSKTEQNFTPLQVPVFQRLIILLRQKCKQNGSKIVSKIKAKITFFILLRQNYSHNTLIINHLLFLLRQNWL